MEIKTDPDSVVKLVGTVVFWIGFVVILSMLRRFICYGISVGAAEVLKGANESIQERMCKWFANGDEILDELRLTKEKNDNKQEK